MYGSKLGLVTLILSSLLIFSGGTFAISGWEEIEDEGDLQFNQGNYSDAAARFSESGHLALLADLPSEAKRVFSKMGRCFSEDRLDDPQLLVEFANSTAFAYFRAAGEANFANASDYLRRSAYLLAYHDLEDQLPAVIDAYVELVISEVERARKAAENALTLGSRGIAGLNYMDAAIMLQSVDNETAADIFGLASQNLVLGAEDALSLPLPGNHSLGGELYRMAARAEIARSRDPETYYQKAGDAFGMAAQEFIETGYLSEGKDNLIWAADVYERSGSWELASTKRAEAAEILEELAAEGSNLDYLLSLEAGIQYDLIGLHREAMGAYANAVSQDYFPFDMVDYIPAIQLELLEILGRGRRASRARGIVDIINTRGTEIISFFGAPAFSGYDIIGEVGPDIILQSGDSLLHSTQVSESLLLATSYIINFLPEEASSILDSIPQEALITDPGNRAFHDLLRSMVQYQFGLATPEEIETRRNFFTELFQGAFISALDDVLPSPLYVPVPRREAMLEVVLEDLDFIVSNDRPTELLYSDAQEISDDYLSGSVRNLTGHLEIADVWWVLGKRSYNRGDLNSSTEIFQSASFHACAGEEYQKAILYRDYTVGSVDADTPLSAASYIVADAMLSANQTLKEQAADYILNNLTIYIGERNSAILISVLEGRTDLGGTSPLLRMAGLGVIAVFVLITSYVILIWEQKNPTEENGESPQETEVEANTTADFRTEEAGQENETPAEGEEEIGG